VKCSDFAHVVAARDGKATWRCLSGSEAAARLMHNSQRERKIGWKWKEAEGFYPGFLRDEKLWKKPVCVLSDSDFAARIICGSP